MTAPQRSQAAQVWLMPPFTPKPGLESPLRAALEALQRLSRNDEGCVEYTVFADGARFVLIEGWDRQSDLDAHTTQAHVRDFVAECAELLAEPFTVTPITPLG
ncbi:putative quinol monooxygenase [Sinomonas sp. P47F7]|uniref:putative quinol monooxygenase n=1 Tax=Sinomonas sp. P47F7 TaxID=3410987 RepID=UPI003BF54876